MKLFLLFDVAVVGGRAFGGSVIYGVLSSLRSDTDSWLSIALSTLGLLIFLSPRLGLDGALSEVLNPAACSPEGDMIGR